MLQPADTKETLSPQEFHYINIILVTKKSIIVRQSADKVFMFITTEL